MCPAVSVGAWTSPIPVASSSGVTLGPLYHVVVDDRVSGPLTGRPAADGSAAAAAH